MSTFSRLVRAAVLLSCPLVLSGCLTIAIIALKHYDQLDEFAATADGRIAVNYEQACSWNGRYDPEEAQCGRLIETRESPAGTEYVHQTRENCVYSFLVDNDSRLVTSWRYISAPRDCRSRSVYADERTP